MTRIPVSSETLEQIRQGKVTLKLNAGRNELSGSVGRFAGAAVDNIESKPPKRRTPTLEAMIIIKDG
ncbi:hypothetical protein [Aeromonas taiwanensis]|uniref:hypothetical protein n=1 Tax=Aeromonas taiwanensis TaxID=633417 RepID=UPI003BA059B7